MARVTGIGGIFSKCSDPSAQRNWYGKYLGLNTDEYRTNFEWRQANDPDKKGFSQWSPFKADSTYFDGEFMINYRVDNLDELLESLAREGIERIGEIQVEEFGKFAHIRDPEGNKVELWEPDDSAYEKIVDGRTC